MIALMKGETAPQKVGGEEEERGEGKMDGKKIDPVNRGRMNGEAEEDRKKNGSQGGKNVKSLSK